MKKKASFIVFLFLLLFSLSLENKVLVLDQEVEGAIQVDDGYDFYSITLNNPPINKENTYNLIFKVEEQKGDLVKRDDFSDVDIYVSMENTMPQDSASATWFSERYGDDLITISKRHIKPGATFHIGVYCQFKCKYKLKAYLNEMIEITEGKVNSFLIPKGSSMYFKFITKDHDYEQLSFSFISPKMRPFQLYISDHNPSNQNTFKVTPSWISGYTFDIVRGDRYYCKNCEYRILIEAKDENADVRMIATYPQSTLALRQGEQIFDSVLEKKAKCYNYDLLLMKYDDNVIINLVLFSGTVITQIYGFREEYDRRMERIPYDQFTFEVSSEKIIVLTQSMINSLKKPFDLGTKLHFCVYGKERASYMITTYFSGQTQNLQRLNFLVMGQTITGYLPKGQVTRYRILDFSSDSHITLSLDNVEGDSTLYGMYSKKYQSLFLDENSLMRDKGNSSFFNSYETFSGYDVDISNEENVCHKEISKSGNLSDEIKKLNCGLFAVIYCDKNNKANHCIYRLRANSDKTVQTLIPRTTFYNILSKDDSDYYQFVIEDDLVDSLSVVLSTISGDTSLLLQKYDDSRKVYKDINLSANSFYFPNVINLSKERMSDKQIVGKYQVVVKAKTFSTYSLYYYVKGDVIKNNPGIEDVELQLDTGDIIEGFFKKGTPYRLYSFEVDGDDIITTDIRITLTKRNFHFNLYVFTDLSTFKLNLDDTEKDTIQGYTWKNDYNNQIVISKNDSKFSDTGPYYIVVARDNSLDKSLLPDIENFYLGVTDEYDEFILYEGLQHGVTLTDKYKSQGYWYAHSDITEKFSLSVNVFFGSINIYVDFEPIDEERINSESTFVYAEKDVTESTFITISPSELQKSCSNSETCPISIYIQKSSKMSSQYLLSPKSRSKKPLIMTPGIMTQNTMNVKESHYFIIEEFTANKDGNIVVKFEEGNGDVYMSLSSDVTITENSFPTEFKWDYKGEDSYQGKIIIVPEMDKNKCQSACRYLITVIGTSIGSTNDNVVYSIVYSNKAKFVNQNVPIKSDIKSGESHYYRFYFDETAESLYVSLYCKDGDADLYMNYGEKLPTFKEYNWYSANPQMDFLTIDKNDAYFVNQHLQYIRGYYTILIYGYTNSTYSLFITSNPKRLIPISSNNPGTCQCKSKNDVCNFRFDDLVPYYEKEPKDVSVVFTTNYVYGYGSMYIKLYNESNYDVNQEFPSSNNKDWSNVNVNKRDFVKVDISKNNPKLTKNSMLLITVQCQEKSLFELNAARIRSSSFQYLDSRRQNLFFLEQSETPTILTFYYQENLPINYEIFTYTGEANVKIYQNYSRSAEQSEYNPIADTFIEPSKPYYNYIKNTVKTVGKNVYFQVTPNTDIGFYVKLNYEQEWTRVEIGQKSTYLVNSNVFNGYFDMMEEYDDVILSVRSEGANMQGTLYYTVNVYERGVASEDKVNPFKLKYPDTSKNGITTDRTFQSLSVKIQQIDKAQYKEKSVRVLFKVVLSGEAVNKNLDKRISVIVSPSTNKVRRYQIRPANIVYSYANEYLNNTAIFDLHKLKKSDDMIIVELSSCTGTYNYAISKDLSYFDIRADNVEYEKKSKTGRTLLTIKNAKEENYYLSIWANSSVENTPDINNDIEYMIYYYSTEEKKYVKTSSTSAILIPTQLSRSAIELKTGILKTKDMYGNVQDADDINFKTFISSKKNSIQSMGSLCQLTRMELEKDYQSKYEPNERRMVISGLKTGVKYAMNIVMENPKTGEIFSFEPVEFTLAYAMGMSLGMTVFVVIVIIILLVAVVYFYLKYKKTKEILKYEQNDLNSLSKIPGMSAEMTSVPDKVKYTTLTSEPDAI